MRPHPTFTVPERGHVRTNLTQVSTFVIVFIIRPNYFIIPYQLKEVDEFSRKFHLTGDILQRLHEFYHHKFGGAIHDDEEIIKELPLALKIVS